LHQFPIDTLKIDGSFINKVDVDVEVEIVRTIVALAWNLGMDVVAVETSKCIKSNLQCDFSGLSFL